MKIKEQTSVARITNNILFNYIEKNMRFTGLNVYSDKIHLLSDFIKSKTYLEIQKYHNLLTSPVV